MTRTVLRNARIKKAGGEDFNREANGPLARMLKGLLHWTAGCCGAFGSGAATDSMMGLQEQLDAARVANRADNAVELRRMRSLSKAQLRKSRSFKRSIMELEGDRVAEISSSWYPGSQRFSSTANDDAGRHDGSFRIASGRLGFDSAKAHHPFVPPFFKS